MHLAVSSASGRVAGAIYLRLALPQLPSVMEQVLEFLMVTHQSRRCRFVPEGAIAGNLQA